jgi:hypothetical protein
MILYIHSDASYLSEPKAHSRVGGYFYLGDPDEPADNPKPNGPIHIDSHIIKTSWQQPPKPKSEPSSTTARKGPTCLHENNPTGTKPRTNRTHPSHHRQLHSRWIRQPTHQDQAIQSNGHAILLDPGQSQTRPVPSPLATRRAEPRRLLHQAPPAHRPTMPT